MLKIRAAELRNTSNHKNMDFFIGSKRATLQVMPTAADGNCLIRAIAHQLFVDKMGSRAQQNATVKLRADVVAFIKDNINDFYYELRNAVYDQKSDEDIKDIKQECDEFLNKHLPLDGTWAGLETIKAVSLIHNVNVFIINEEGGCRIPYGFKQQYENSILLAYRLSAGNSNLIRNHYDSVVHIEQPTIFSCEDNCIVNVCSLVPNNNAIIEID